MEQTTNNSVGESAPTAASRRKGMVLIQRFTLAIIGLALFALMGYLLGMLVQESHLQIPGWVHQMVRTLLRE